MLAPMEVNYVKSCGAVALCPGIRGSRNFLYSTAVAMAVPGFIAVLWVTTFLGAT